MKFIVNSLIFLIYLAAMALGVYESIVFSFSVITLIFTINFFICAFTVVFIFSQKRHYTAKLSWILIVSLLPIIGTVLFFVFGLKYSRRTSSIKNVSRKAKFYEMEDYGFTKDIISKKVFNKMHREFTFITNCSRRPVYQNTDANLIFDGNDKFEQVLESLKEAKSFIHIQYYIIREGWMWEEVKKILISKAKSGVEVRVLYDAVGSALTLNKSKLIKLRRWGIRIYPFGPVGLNFFRGEFNFRNHRKTIVIDNKVAYTGGFNIGDEYISREAKMGYWRDTHIKIEGELVNSLNVVFAQDWFQTTKENLTDKPSKYFHKFKYTDKDKTIAQMIDDGPETSESILKDVLVKQIMSAKKRIWISSPYLLPSDDLTSAIISASKSGIDVRIITPGIDDGKKYIMELARSNYRHLIVNGVRIFEYGSFIHAKQLLIDDELAIVGSLNLDYRSLFLNYEAAIVMYGQKQVDQLAQQFNYDFLNSSEITNPNKFTHYGLLKRIKLGFLRIFLPIL